MNREELFTLNDLLRLGNAVLCTMPEHEADAAIAWLAEHVVNASNVAAQLILFQTWQSIYGRNLFERIFQEGSN